MTSKEEMEKFTYHPICFMLCSHCYILFFSIEELEFVYALSKISQFIAFENARLLGQVHIKCICDK